MFLVAFQIHNNGSIMTVQAPKIGLESKYAISDETTEAIFQLLESIVNCAEPFYGAIVEFKEETKKKKKRKGK